MPWYSCGFDALWLSLRTVSATLLTQDINFVANVLVGGQFDQPFVRGCSGIQSFYLSNIWTGTDP
jgi:hypothetical protein